MTNPTAAAPDKSFYEGALDAIEGFGTGRAAILIYGLAVAFSVFQLYVSAFSPLPSIVVRSVHVGFLCLLTFAVSAQLVGGWKRAFAWTLAIVSFTLGIYHWIFHDDLIVRAGNPTAADIAVGVVVIVLLFEAARRVVGIALPLICGIFLAYCLLGQYLPYPFDHRGYDAVQVIDHIFGGTEGIYGIPIYVSATYIFLFILFGSFLERAGMIQLFTDVAMGTVGHRRGGLGLRRRRVGGQSGAFRNGGFHHGKHFASVSSRRSPARSKRQPAWVARSCRR